MKKIILAIILGSLILTASGQDTTKTKFYRTELGIDATGFIKQFLNFGTTQYPEYYNPTYFITYRCHFKVGNIRFAVGGNYSDHDINPISDLDSNKYHYRSYSFDTRIGWEFITKLSKRWQVFYGLDFKPSYTYTKNDATCWNGGYSNGNENNSTNYGFSPLLGFRFNVTKRICISTEANFTILLRQTESRKYYIPVTSTNPPKPDVKSPTYKEITTSFNQPLSLFFTFDL
jgi:hypothetical protein